MKYPAKVSIVTTSVVLMLVLCLTPSAFGQAKPTKSDAKSKPASSVPNDSDPWQRRLLELHFENVPLSEVANQLSDQFPEINFVVHPGVKDIPILLKLRSVTLDDIFAALDIAAPGSGQAIDPATGLPGSGGVLQINKLGDRMVSFTLRPPQYGPEATFRPVCRAFSLGRYLAGKSEKDVNAAMNDIEEALQIAWKMLQSAEQSNAKVQPPQLSLHRPTKLLIVAGQPDQVAVVEQVISQLEGDATVSATPLPGPGTPGNAHDAAMRAFAARYGLSAQPFASTNSHPAGK